MVNSMSLEYASGKIVLINGVSSSGKTTLCNEMRKSGFVSVSLDDIRVKMALEAIQKSVANEYSEVEKFLTESDIFKAIEGDKINTDTFSAGQIAALELFNNLAQPHFDRLKLEQKDIDQRLFQESKPYIDTGKNVLIDYLFSEDDEIKPLEELFVGISFTKILLYKTLQENLANCFKRNSEAHDQDDPGNVRPPVMIVGQYCEFYKFQTSQELSESVKLGPIDKAQVKSIFDRVIPETRKILEWLPVEDAAGQELLQNTKTVVSEVSAEMKVDSAEEVYITPSAHYDMIVSYDGHTPAEVAMDIIGFVDSLA